MKTVLVTGGAGFIGSNLCKSLLKKRLKVICIDDLSGGYKENLPKNKNFTFLKGSCLNTKILKKAFDYEPDIVFHLAARKGFNITSVLSPLNDLKINTLSTLKLLDFSANHNVKKFMFASSSCVYGNNKNKNDENSKINLDTPYAISKFTSEEYCRFYQNYKNLNITIFRIFNTYGPGERTKKHSNVICKFFENTVKNKPIKITGNNTSRSYLYIDDLIEAFQLVIDTNKFNNVCLNVGYEKDINIEYLAKLVKECSRSDSRIINKPLRKWDKVKKRSVNINKIKNLSKWKPKINIRDGINKYYIWFKKNCV